MRASLAGMTMKFSLRRQGERLALPAHGEDGDWILKTPDAAYPGLVDNEYAMMRLARAIGIEVPEVELLDRERIDELGPGAWTSEERRAYAVRRFDRSASGRIHIEDFAQVLGRFGAGDDKYRSNVQTVAGLAFRGRDEASLREMVRRTVFNLLIGNGDAHLKNWSLIYPDRRVAVLSPAYDLVCTSVHLPNPEDPELGLPFFEAERLSQVCREHFRRLQETLEVDGEHVLAVLDDTLERFFDTWTPAATEYVPTQVRTWITDHAEDTRRRLRG
ncbi:MAG: HipA domain-containing protein [Pseudoclavibacter sp.]|nr:HipA domain-containing protein [Pseudoclavibacter sp.]